MREQPLQLFTARSLVVAPDLFLAGGGLLCGAEVKAVLSSPGEVERAAQREGLGVIDLGDVVLAPGLVNAHVHLELSNIEVGAAGSFRAWVEALMRARRVCGPDDLEQAVRDGADRLVATGTTAVGDIDSSGAARRALAQHPLGGTVYRELIDAGSTERAAKLIAELRRWDAEQPGSADGLREGLSPHAPYTVSAPFFESIGAEVAASARPVTIHWAETPEEVEWMATGTGPLQGLVDGSPGRPGLDLIESAGLLGTGTSLVHGNHPGQGEIERIAASGATCVHCPGSHRYFEREPFPLEDYLRAGVPVALGTDSRASNDDLDMRREMALLRSTAPHLAPRQVWEMATVSGARAIGRTGRAGSLHVGERADFSAFGTSVFDAEACLDELTATCPPVVGSWIGGRRVDTVPPGGEGTVPA